MENRGEQRNRRSPVLACIAAKERRTVLEALFTWGSPETEQRLAAYIAANELGTPSIEETEKETIHVALVHSHLPLLESAGLVEWDRDEQLVEATDHPALADPRFHRLLTVDSAGVDAVFRALSHDERRIVLTILRNRDSPISPDELAREVCERRVDESEAGTRSVDGVLSSLYHSHLPKLANAGFVDYDRETGRIQYANHPVVEEVFAILFERDEDLAEKFAAFFDGLDRPLRRRNGEQYSEVESPDFWRRPHHE